jgi:transcriptional regulator with XRE-family HTH domain
MSKTNDTPQVDKYNALFATSLRAFMDAHPDTGEKTTQKALADYLGVRPQTVSYYCTGESLPNCEQLLRIADFFGVTCDFLMTGRRIENKPVRELLGLSENTVQSMKLVKEGYFEDSPYMLAALDTLLGNKDFYLSMEQAANWYGKKEQAPDDMKEFCEWKAAQYMQGFLLEFFSLNLKAIYEQMRGNE